MDMDMSLGQQMLAHPVGEELKHLLKNVGLSEAEVSRLCSNIATLFDSGGSWIDVTEDQLDVWEVADVRARHELLDLVELMATSQGGRAGALASEEDEKYDEDGYDEYSEDEVIDESNRFDRSEDGNKSAATTHVSSEENLRSQSGTLSSTYDEEDGEEHASSVGLAAAVAPEDLVPEYSGARVAEDEAAAAVVGARDSDEDDYSQDFSEEDEDRNAMSLATNPAADERKIPTRQQAHGRGIRRYEEVEVAEQSSVFPLPHHQAGPAPATPLHPASPPRVAMPAPSSAFPAPSPVTLVQASGERLAAVDGGESLSFLRPREEKSPAAVASLLSDMGAIHRHNSEAALSAAGSQLLEPYHKQMIRPGFWKLGVKIGGGTFGTVHQGLNMDNGFMIAVKVMLHRGRQEEEVKELENEIKLMRSLDHPNIVRYLGCDTDEDSLYIFQEWVPGGSIASMLKQYGPLSEPVVKRYLAQILHGLAYLHDNRVVHRDVKGGNVLVNEFGVAKLADFGCSKRMGPDGTLGDTHQSMRGTPFFMAPEVMQNDHPGRASDIWSFGGVALQMATGEPPWKRLGCRTPMVLFYHVIQSNEPPPMDGFGLSEALQNFIRRCFERDVKRRPTAMELLEDPFLRDVELPAETSTYMAAGRHPEAEAVSRPGDTGARHHQRSPGMAATSASQRTITELEAHGSEGEERDVPQAHAGEELRQSSSLVEGPVPLTGVFDQPPSRGSSQAETADSLPRAGAGPEDDSLRGPTGAPALLPNPAATPSPSVAGQAARRHETHSAQRRHRYRGATSEDAEDALLGESRIEDGAAAAPSFFASGEESQKRPPGRHHRYRREAHGSQGPGPVVAPFPRPDAGHPGKDTPAATAGTRGRAQNDRPPANRTREPHHAALRKAPSAVPRAEHRRGLNHGKPSRRQLGHAPSSSGPLQGGDGGGRAPGGMTGRRTPVGSRSAFLSSVQKAGGAPVGGTSKPPVRLVADPNASVDISSKRPLSSLKERLQDPARRSTRESRSAAGGGRQRVSKAGPLVEDEQGNAAVVVEPGGHGGSGDGDSVRGLDARDPFRAVTR